VREKALPALLLAKTLELITTITSPTTGITELYLISEDANGLPVRTKLGKTLVELAENIDIEAAQRLQETTVAHLQQEQWQHIDQRAQLQQKIRDELKQVLSDRRNDYEDPIYLRFETAARTAIQTLKNN
jgi:hypothetical protein